MNILIFYGIFFVLLILTVIENFFRISFTQKKAIIAVFMIVYVVLSVFYNGPYGDYYAYENAFVSVNANYSFGLNVDRFEVLYELLSYIVRQVSSSYKVFRLVLAIIVMLLWYNIYTDKFFSNNGKYSLTLLMIVWLLSFGHIFVVRSTIAYTICLFSFRYVRNRKFFKFLICFLFAIGFHSLAICWFPVFIIYNTKFNAVTWQRIMAVIIVVLLIVAPYIPVFLLKISPLFNKIPFIGEHIAIRIVGYIGHGIDATYGKLVDYVFLQVKGLLNIFVLIFMGLFILKKSHFKIREHNNENYLFAVSYNQYLIGAALYIIALNSSLVFTRVAGLYAQFEYFFPLFLLELPYIKQNRNYKKVALVIFVVYLLARMTIAIISTEMGTFF